MKNFIAENLVWTHQPNEYLVADNKIVIITDPNTDLWQRTYYGFRYDNAPVLQMKTTDKYFSFVVKTKFNSHNRFDQSGIVVYLDSDNWIKASAEYENNKFQRLGCVVTNNGYSDWSSTDVPASINEIWLRLSRRENDYRIECSFDGVDFKQMRICRLHEGNNEISFGVYACSPGNASFKAEFSDMLVTECKWEVHEG